MEKDWICNSGLSDGEELSIMIWISSFLNRRNSVNRKHPNSEIKFIMQTDTGLTKVSDYSFRILMQASSYVPVKDMWGSEYYYNVSEKSKAFNSEYDEERCMK